MSLLRRLAVRRLQIAFIFLLAVSTAQLTYWLVDEVRYTAQVRAQIVAAHEATGVAAAPQVLAELDRQRFHRLNRYAWEGAFFLAVLLGAMAVVSHALREESALRRRQEDFVAAVSHELKSPVASLRLSAETLALRDPPAARRAELLERQVADLARLERTIGNILEASRLDAMKSPEPGAVVLADAVASTLDELRSHATELSVAIAADVPRNLVVRADEDGTRTILRNLLHNAIRAAAGGRVSVSVAKDKGGVRLIVRDSGVGFPTHEGARLFDKFYRLGGTDRGRTTGTGLGLYLVRRYAERDGARVSGESEGPGRGATFIVTWPIWSTAS
ncbi:MAG: sensor histidine kinase [Gemmatimonadales bacterium]